MNFLHGREYLNAGDSMVVNCDTECNVCVMTDAEFEDYKAGRQFRYIGGHYKRFPAHIQVPQAGFWNAVLDLGGAAANIRYSITYLKRT